MSGSSRREQVFAETQDRVLRQFSESLGWGVDFDQLRACETFAPPPVSDGDIEIEPERKAALHEVARLLLGVLALKFQAFLILEDEPVEEVFQLLLAFDRAKREENALMLAPQTDVHEEMRSGEFIKTQVKEAHSNKERRGKGDKGRRGPPPKLANPRAKFIRRSSSVAFPDPPPRAAQAGGSSDEEESDERSIHSYSDPSAKSSPVLDAPHTCDHTHDHTHEHTHEHARKQRVTQKDAVTSSLDEEMPASLRMGASTSRAGMLTSGLRAPQHLGDEKGSFFEHPVPQTESFMVDMVALPHMRALSLPDVFLNLYYCIRSTNILVMGARQKKTAFLEDSLEFLKQPIQRGTYCSGAIRQKEPHTFLFNGGTIGPVQVGIPPETIKTSMRAGEEVPQIYVLPPTLFSGDVNYAEVEFPIYFNYFVKKAFVDKEKRIVLIGDQAELDKVRAVFRESFYGPQPDQIFIEEEIHADAKKRGYAVDLQAERGTIAAKGSDGGPVPLDDFMWCIPFESAKDPITGKNVFVADLTLKRQKEPEKALGSSIGVAPVKVGEYVTTRVVNNDGLIQFFEEEQKLASVDTNSYPHAHECGDHFAADTLAVQDAHHSHDIAVPGVQAIPHSHHDDELLRSAFEPPTFGVTFLGTSHGFDAKGQTTGFIIWINGEGICVDPPAFTSRYLRANGIPSSAVRHLILTHCHSDHDGGMLKKITDGERCELFTTRTVHESFCRKVKAVASLDSADYYDFTPVPIGIPIRILGAEFEFDYAFHTIPTVRFKVRYADKCIAYSADTYFDPTFYAKIRREGVINPAREASLNYFLMEADLIIHESGVPPIHTALAVLNDLPPAIKRKMLIVHCNAIPPTATRQVEVPDPDKPGEFKMEEQEVKLTGLRIPGAGLEHTLRLTVGNYEEGRSFALQRFKRFSNLFAFRSLEPPTIFQLYQASFEQEFLPGEVIIRSGEPADRFFIIHSGRVEVFAAPPTMVRMPSSSSNLNQHKHVHEEPPPFDREGAEVTAVLHAGDAFGESALRQTSGIPRNATVVAVTRTSVLSLRSAEFQLIVERAAKRAQWPANTAHLTLDQDLEQIARMRPKVKSVLSKTYLFTGLSEEQATFVAALLGSEKFFPKGSVIVHQGDKRPSMFIIETGNVQLETLEGNGENKPFMRLGAGDIFGEMSVMTGSPRTATCVATQDTTLLELTKASFDQLMMRYPSVRVKTTQLLDGRLKQKESTKGVQSEFAVGSPRVSLDLRRQSFSKPNNPQGNA